MVVDVCGHAGGIGFQPWPQAGAHSRPWRCRPGSDQGRGFRSVVFGCSVSGWLGLHSGIGFSTPGLSVSSPGARCGRRYRGDAVMTDVSRRAFAESLAVAALAPLVGISTGSVPVLEWTAPPDVARAMPSAFPEAL